ncbi:GNAT family N-acetyltransferase [Salipaludibacillus daqingensis]|uniref:GNAT family N-acetyltransferase n=1 Tax=Salipaludibacillus daqingensis TaxID=3041001 RepID=UPI002473D816|nr:GNAT family N-acetyltransferase [Salipaludibacillus daqingensis]
MTHDNETYQIKKMTKDAATNISFWEYPSPYELYSMDGSQETISALLSKDYYLVSTAEEPLFGYFCIGNEARVPGGYQAKIYDDMENVIDLGLGIHPNFTGKGLGISFVSSILQWIEKNLTVNEVRLVVATVNDRAIRTYQRAGFISGEIFFTQVGNWDMPFIVMRKSVTKS